MRDATLASGKCRNCSRRFHVFQQNRFSKLSSIHLFLTRPLRADFRISTSVKLSSGAVGKQIGRREQSSMPTNKLAY